MHDVAPYPFRCRPHFVEKLWGGTWIARTLAAQLMRDAAVDAHESAHAHTTSARRRAIAAGVDVAQAAAVDTVTPDPDALRHGERGPIGEAWMVADFEHGHSAIDSGPLRGLGLRDAMDRWGAGLLGGAPPNGNGNGNAHCSARAFPLLVKLVDAGEPLSVQVHPSPDDLSQLPEGARSKDECWIVLDVAAPTGRDGGDNLHGLVFPGVLPGVTRRDLEHAAREGTVLDCMQRVNARPGDIIRIPPGTVHAIGSGVTLLEIQEPSDTTYRLWDYDRVGLDGRPRPLQIERALSVARLDRAGLQLTLQTERHVWGSWASVPTAPARYRIEQITLGHDTASGGDHGSSSGNGPLTVEPIDWRIAEDAPQVVVVTRGHVTLEAGPVTLDLSTGEAAILPAALAHVRVTPRRNGRPGAATLIVAAAGAAVDTRRRLVDLT